MQYQLLSATYVRTRKREERETHFFHSQAKVAVFRIEIYLSGAYALRKKTIQKKGNVPYTFPASYVRTLYLYRQLRLY